MKRKLLLVLFLAGFGLEGWAQQIPISTYEYLSVGNIKAPIFSDGPLFWERRFWTRDNPFRQWESPKNSGKGTILKASLWIGGLDQQNNLYLCAETYRQNLGGAGNNVTYFFGPVANNYNAAFDAKYNKVWKVTSAEIDYHKIHYRHRFYVMPDGIATWPAHGDITNGEAANLAPFVDVNQNNIYDPANGDYPVIRGAETLYFILNDKRSAKEPFTPAMNLEVHGMAYAFDNPADSALFNSIFINYRIINRSTKNYKNVHAGLWTDFDIGYYADDYVGCDVSRNAYFGYNGDDFDVSPTNPAIGYGADLPAQGVAFLGNTKMTSFLYYENNRNPVNGNPSTATDFYNYLRGIWRNNQPVTFGGNGTDPLSEPYRYMFPGDSDLTGLGYTPRHAPPFNWTMNTIEPSGNDKLDPTDVRGIGAIGPFNLNAGEQICFDVAFPFAQSDSNGHIVKKLQRYIDQINQFHTATYGNNCLQNQTATNPPNGQRHAFESLFPNPASNQVILYFDQRLTEDVTIQVYDINGRKQSSKLLKQDAAAVQTLDLSQLKPGIYILNLTDSGSSKKLKLVVSK